MKVSSWMEKIRQRIHQNREVLERSLDVHDTLLEWLCGKNYMDATTMQKIQSRDTPTGKSAEFLSWLSKCSDDVMEEVMNILESDKQQHVVNFMKGKENTVDFPLSDDIRSVLYKLAPYLTACMDADNGLLEKMLSKDALSRRQYEIVEAKQTNTDTVKALLEIVLRKSIRSFKDLIDSLTETNQEHVANMLQTAIKGLAVAEKPKTETRSEDSNQVSSWMEKIRERIHQNGEVLERSLDVHDTLLEWLSWICLDERTMQKIQSRDTPTGKSAEFLSWLSKCSDGVMEEVMNILENDNQQHVVNFMEGKKVDLPLSDDIRSEVYKLTDSLNASIDAGDDLLEKMLSKDALKLREYEALKAKPTDTDKVNALLEFVLRKSIRSFNDLIDSLTETNQEHVANTLQKAIKGLAVAEKPKTETRSEDSNQDENWFNLDLGIKYRWSAVRAPEIFNRGFAAISNSNHQLPKKIIIAVLFLGFSVASCVLMEKPLNEAVVVGSDPVEFKCKSNQGYRLKWWTHQSQSIQVLFDGYSISKEAESFCSVENGEPGKFYLKLTATREAAQTYACLEPGTTKESSADLIVIEREKQCETDSNSSHVIITCDHEYSGNWMPDLEWSYNGTLITEGVNASIVSNKSVSSTLTVPISSNDRKFTCTTKFDIRGKPHWTTSDNIPDYISDSVLTVEANQVIADEHEAPSSASETSVGLVIGIIIALAITVFTVIIVFVLLMKRKKGLRNEEALDVAEPLAT